MPPEKHRVVVAVDIGGTFTDVVFQDLDTKALAHRKVSTTTGAPAEGIVRGVREGLADFDGDGSVERFLHGTTIATNALIEHKGVRCGLLINAGLRGVAQMQSGALGEGRKARGHRPQSLVSEEDLYEIGGRVDRNGIVLEELDEQAVREAAVYLRDSGVGSIGICFMFSFLNSEHERRARAILVEEHPSATVLCSSDILPRVREWPRCSTLLLSSYLEPIMVEYIGRLQAALSGAGVAPESQFIMESNGGVMPFSAVISGGRSIYTLLSGPAAAVQAAQRTAEATGLRNLVTMDIGGTSCDIAFVEGGTPLEVTAGKASGYDLYVPMLDITTIGAGGGTIARVTDDGRLIVGPDSAGAVPGPAAYGRGGTLATTTDADVVLGYLNPAAVLAGEVTILPDRARAVIEETIARPLGISVEDAALGIRRINDAHMADAIRVVAARKGLDLSECTLVACGGAGPLHAGFIAAELGMRKIFVPPSPGVFSALGLLCADLYHDYVQSVLTPLDELDGRAILSTFASLEEKALEDLLREGFAREEVGFVRELDARYGGQGYEIRVALPDVDEPELVEAFADRFHTEHERLYGTSAREERVVIVSYRLRAFVVMPKYEPTPMEGRSTPAEAIAERPVRFEDGVLTAQIYERPSLISGQQLFGPTIVEQIDTTVLVPPAWVGTVDDYGNIVCETRPA